MNCQKWNVHFYRFTFFNCMQLHWILCFGSYTFDRRIIVVVAKLYGVHSWAGNFFSHQLAGQPINRTKLQVFTFFVAPNTNRYFISLILTGKLHTALIDANRCVACKWIFRPHLKRKLVWAKVDWPLVCGCTHTAIDHYLIATYFSVRRMKASSCRHFV